MLFESLKLKNNPHHHWSDNIGWKMENALKHVVLNKTKEVMLNATFFSLSCDGVTLVGSQARINAIIT